MWYEFTVQTNDYNKQKVFRLYVDTGVDILYKGLCHLRNGLYRKRLKSYTGHICDIDEISEYFISNGYLPMVDRSNIDSSNIIESMIPMYQVHAVYKITGIKSILKK